VESVFVSTVTVNKNNLLKAQAISFAFSMFPAPKFISEIFSAMNFASVISYSVP